MKLKIVNLPKFIRSVIIIFSILIGIMFVISNKSLSHGDTQYKTIYVSQGDTLWNIAKCEKQDNPYFENKDIRDIVNQIKKINSLTNSNLVINQELKIPAI